MGLGGTSSFSDFTFITYLFGMIIWVRVVFRKTVVGD